jgi:hypothetical protein
MTDGRRSLGRAKSLIVSDRGGSRTTTKWAVDLVGLKAVSSPERTRHATPAITTPSRASVPSDLNLRADRGCRPNGPTLPAPVVRAQTGLRIDPGAQIDNPPAVTGSSHPHGDKPLPPQSIPRIPTTSAHHRLRCIAGKYLAAVSVLDLKRATTCSLRRRMRTPGSSRLPLAVRASRIPATWRHP